MKKLNLSIISMLIIPAFIFLAGCQQNAPQNPTNTQANAATKSGTTVDIKNFAFSERSLTVKVGATVTWTNNDSMNHTITSDTGLFDSGNIADGQKFMFTFTKAGSFAYHCSIHPAMSGVIIVNP